MAVWQLYLTSLLLSFEYVIFERATGTSLRFAKSQTNYLNDRNHHILPLMSTHAKDLKASKFSESRELYGVNNVLDGSVTEEKENPSYSHRDRYELYGTRHPLNLEKEQTVSRIRQSLSETSHTLIKRLCNMKGRTHVCFQHGMSKCSCQGQLADCSGKKFVPNISYIPKLPKNIKCLIFKDNQAKFLDDSYFANVSDYKVIDFSYNTLVTISKRTFARFNGGLQYLILNDNSLSYKNIQNVFNYPPSQRLDLIAAGIMNPIPKDFFKPYSKISTSELYLDLNFMQKLDLNEFSVLKKLRYLSAKNCSIRQLTSAYMPALEYLYLENNPISSFPESCVNRSLGHKPLSVGLPFSRATSMFPALKGIELKNAQITQLPLHKACLPKLEILDLSLNSISTIRSFSLQNVPSLKVFLLSRMRTNVTVVESDAFSSDSLLSLSFSKNHVQFASPNISDRMFGHCPSLKVLHIGHNNFSQVPESSYIQLFHGLDKLEFLFLGSNQIKFIPSKAFRGLPNVKKLFLYLNEITHIPPKAFAWMKSLRYLYLDENKINTVSSESFTDEEVRDLVQINLSRNDFQCNCDLLWFQSWLVQSGGRQFEENSTGYWCADRPGTMVTQFVLSQQACLYSRKTYILFTVILSVMLISFIVFVIFYHYRWDIRLALYKRRFTAVSTDRPDDFPDPTHDVFIIYCEDDSNWVIDQLLHRVENVWGLKAYIHERDFEAGRYIMENIVIAIDRCQHILVVMSERFADSKWCDVELQLCQTHMLENSLPSILVVELESVEVRKMSRIMLALRRTTTFLEWPENPRLEDEFWGRLEKRVRQVRGRRQRQ